MKKLKLETYVINYNDVFCKIFYFKFSLSSFLFSYFIDNSPRVLKRLDAISITDVPKKIFDNKCINYHLRFTILVSIAVPTAGDASFISYKCSLHDFCQQCNILPPRFSTSGNDTGFSSSVSLENIFSDFMLKLPFGE